MSYSLSLINSYTAPRRRARCKWTCPRARACAGERARTGAEAAEQRLDAEEWQERQPKVERQLIPPAALRLHRADREQPRDALAHRARRGMEPRRVAVRRQRAARVGCAHETQERRCCCCCCCCCCCRRLPSPPPPPLQRADHIAILHRARRARCTWTRACTTVHDSCKRCTKKVGGCARRARGMRRERVSGNMWRKRHDAPEAAYASRRSAPYCSWTTVVLLVHLVRARARVRREECAPGGQTKATGVQL